jgi:nucleotide-binding universal stress UspA family protein
MFATIAVGLDGSATAGEAVRAASELARRFDAELVLLSVFRPRATVQSGGHEEDWATNPAARQRESLDRAEASLREGGVRARSLVGEGDPGDALVALAQDCGADLLVVGSKGMERRVLGSVPNTVTHKARCSVLLVKTT